MKLLYTSDLLGNEGHYGRLLALAGTARPDCLVLGGNCLPDDSALDRPLMGRGQPAFVRQQFRKFATGLREASACELLVVFGNHDWGSSVTEMEALAGEGLLKTLKHTEPTRAAGLAFLGYSCSPPTDWYVKEFERLDLPGDPVPLMGGARWDSRFSRPCTNSASVIFKKSKAISEDLALLTPPAGPWIFVAHTPPFDTKLDRAFGGRSIGSRAVRAAIEKYSPFLSLHGHVRESPQVSGEAREVIGRTTAVNPGQTPRALQYALIELDANAGVVQDVKLGQQT